jgi:5-methylcytosine-specific restriction endonuclease McrA
MSCGVQLAPAPVAAPPAKVVASAPDRFAVHLTIGRATHEKLRHAQALLSHSLPSGDLASVLDLALDALVEKLEKRKFAKTDTPRPRRRRIGASHRHVPAHVKRAVWARDRGRCTFVGDTGHRCNARTFLEYDHVKPVARGGEATVAGVRLRCRMHNQLEAERVFGSGFMNGKREKARRGREARRPEPSRRPTARQPAAALPGTAPRPVTCAAPSAGSAAAEDHAQDVMACLRTLGVRAEQARRAMALSATTPATTLEGRVRAALQYLGPRPCRPM